MVMKKLRKYIGRTIGIALGTGLVIAGGLVGVEWIRYRLSHAVTDNAFVKTDMVNVSPLVAGRIERLFVDEGDMVEKGSLLARIDDRDLRKAVKVREAEIKGIEKRIELARLTVRRISEEVERDIEVAMRALNEATERHRAVVVRLRKAEKDFKRAEALFQEGTIPQADFDTTKAHLDAMEAEEQGMRSVIELREKELEKAKVQRMRVEEAKKSLNTLLAELEVAKRALDVALQRLSHTDVKSPISGVVAKGFFNEGDYISPGMPLFSIYDPENIYIVANLEETKLEGVDVGDPVDISVDAFPGRTFGGRVVLIGKATGSEFALIPRDVSAGEFTKVVQRIPIKIAMDNDLKSILKPGLSVRVGIKR